MKRSREASIYRNWDYVDVAGGLSHTEESFNNIYVTIFIYDCPEATLLKKKLICCSIIAFGMLLESLADTIGAI
jgi:hypothetical protein